MGRTGLVMLRQCLSGYRDDVDIVAVNDIIPIDNLAYLLRYDSVHGRLPCSVEIEERAPGGWRPRDVVWLVAYHRTVRANWLIYQNRYIILCLVCGKFSSIAVFSGGWPSCRSKH